MKFLNESIDNIAEIKNEIHDSVLGLFEYGNAPYETVEEFANDFDIDVTDTQTEELFQYYLDLVDEGPVAFYEKFKDTLDFSDDFVNFCGDFEEDLSYKGEVAEKSQLDPVEEFGLPLEVSIPLADLDVEEGDDDEAVGSAINDYLSDKYGYLVNNYYFELIDGNIEVTDIDWDTTSDDELFDFEDSLDESLGLNEATETRGALKALPIDDVVTILKALGSKHIPIEESPEYFYLINDAIKCNVSVGNIEEAIIRSKGCDDFAEAVYNMCDKDLYNKLYPDDYKYAV